MIIMTVTESLQTKLMFRTPLEIFLLGFVPFKSYKGILRVESVMVSIILSLIRMFGA